MAEHCVKIIIPLSDGGHGAKEEREAIFKFEDLISEAIDEKSLGEFDGNEFGGGICTLYLYGHDADKLFLGIETIVRSSPLCKRAKIYKRYGDADDRNAKEITFTIDGA